MRRGCWSRRWGARSRRGRLGGVAMARVREGCDDSKRDDMKGGLPVLQEQ